MDELDGDNSDTKIVDVLFDGRAGLFLDISFAAADAVELINIEICE